jgi:type VI protein secretion system component Hcp
MRKVSAAILSLLVCAPLLAARPARAASSALPAAAQAECSNVNVGKNEGKFTGQITGGPTGTLIQVTSGDQSVTVIYNGSVLVCEGGQPTSVQALTPGATVVAYGRMEKKGKSFKMTATKILVAGSPVVGQRTYESGDVLAPGISNSSGVTARDDWNSGASGASNSGNSGASQGSGSAAGQDNWQGGPTGESQDGGRGQSSSTLSCSALLFSITMRDNATGLASGHASTSGITCRMPVDQQAMQLAQDSLNGRRMSSLRLTCQNELEATLSNAEISEVQFTSEGNSPVVNVTFVAQRVELTHTPSGARITF